MDPMSQKTTILGKVLYGPPPYKENSQNGRNLGHGGRIWVSIWYPILYWHREKRNKTFSQ